MTHHDFGAVLVTRSEKGMTLVHPDIGCFHVPTIAQQVYDVSGAGDTVAAMLATAIGCGLDPLHAVQLANIAAGLVVAKLGTAALAIWSCSARFAVATTWCCKEKLLTRSQLRQVLAEWRAQNKRVDSPMAASTCCILVT